MTARWSFPFGQYAGEKELHEFASQASESHGEYFTPFSGPISMFLKQSRTQPPDFLIIKILLGCTSQWRMLLTWIFFSLSTSQRVTNEHHHRCLGVIKPHSFKLLSSQGRWRLPTTRHPTNIPLSNCCANAASYQDASYSKLCVSVAAWPGRKGDRWRPAPYWLILTAAGTPPQWCTATRPPPPYWCTVNGGHN